MGYEPNVPVNMRTSLLLNGPPGLGVRPRSIFDAA